MPRKKKVVEEKVEEKVAEAKKEKVEEESKEKKKISKGVLEKKAKKLEKKIKQDVDLKEKLKEVSKKKETLVPLEDYVKYGTYIGTKVIVPHMRKYVYKRRADGIAIINTNMIDEKLKEAIEFISKYSPEDFIVVCKREAGWKAAELFSKLTGVRVFTKKYPAGIITNTSLPNFMETELLVVCDPWLDKNALRDATKIKKKVVAFCDTNNYSFGVNKEIPCNNKSNKSLGLVFYILTREYLKARGMEKEIPPIDEFVGEKQ